MLRGALLPIEMSLKYGFLVGKCGFLVCILCPRQVRAPLMRIPGV